MGLKNTMLELSVFKSTLKQGVLLGVCFCAYTLMMWLTRLDTTYLSIGQYLDIAIIVLPLSVILCAIRQENTKRGLTIFQRVIIAIFVGLISTLIYDPFLYLYHEYINPDWFDSVLHLKETELNSINAPKYEIEGVLVKMKQKNASQSGMFRLSSLIPSVLIIPTLIALVSLAVIRRK